jgi:hypothetical protein
MATMTLTYIYADSTAVLGPLATFAEPHAYDLCEFHARKLTVPNGWSVIKEEISQSGSGLILACVADIFAQSQIRTQTDANI